MDTKLADVEGCCRAIVRDLRALLSWAWDDYTGAMLAAFATECAEEILATLERRFASRWDEGTILGAPPYVQAIAERLGSVREGQLLFVSSPEGPVVAYGAWWPWGNGEMISLRIGLEAQIGDDLLDEFAGWFADSAQPG